MNNSTYPAMPPVWLIQEVIKGASQRWQQSSMKAQIIDLYRLYTI